MQVTLEYAVHHLTDLITAMDRGEEVEIERAEKPSVRLMPVTKAQPDTIRDGKRILGLGRGEMRVPSLEEWQAMDELHDGPILPPSEL